VETNIKMNELGFNLQAIKDELIWNPRTWYKNIEHRTKKPNLESSNIRGSVGIFLKMM
jgi:hypothetical protein